MCAAAGTIVVYVRVQGCERGSGAGRLVHSCTSGHPEEDALGEEEGWTLVEPPPLAARLLQTVINVASHNHQFVAGRRPCAATVPL